MNKTIIQPKHTMTTKTQSAWQVHSYLNFDGRCEEALEFYKKALGAEVEMILRFKDNPDNAAEGGGCADLKADPNKIMHSSLRIGQSTVMMSDCQCAGETKFQGFSLSLSLQTEEEAQRVFNALADGGQVEMPLVKTFFAQSFGLVSDRFGVSWMIIIPAQN